MSRRKKSRVSAPVDGARPHIDVEAVWRELHAPGLRGRSFFAWLAYIAVLRPLIRRDYRLRAAGKRPDRMHWADALACRWGWFTDAA
jgi:hypothetical protein